MYGTILGVINGDTRGLDYGSHVANRVCADVLAAQGRHRFSSEAASGEFLKLRQRKLAEALNPELEWYRASGI